MTTGERPSRRERGPLQKLRHRATAALFRGLASLVPRLSLEAAQRLGAALGSAGRILSPGRRRRVQQHIALALPDADSATRARILAETYRSMGMVATESLWAPAWRDERDLARITVETPEALEAILAAMREGRRGLLLFTGHIGCWELMGPWLRRTTGAPMMAVASEPKVPEMKDAFRAHRERTGTKIVWRGEAGLPLMRHLRGGGVAVLLVDHNLVGEGVAVPFFGQPAHTLLAPARLALRASAAVAVAAAYRDGHGRIRVHFEAPFDVERYARDFADARERETAFTADYTAQIEAAVRRDPGQWLWMHRRWKAR